MVPAKVRLPNLRGVSAAGRQLFVGLRVPDHPRDLGGIIAPSDLEVIADGLVPPCAERGLAVGAWQRIRRGVTG